MSGSGKIMGMFWLIALPVLCYGQPPVTALQQLLHHPPALLKTEKHFAQARAFYELDNYQLFWLTPGNKRLSVLANLISNAGDLGLVPQDYQYQVFNDYPRALQNLRNENDSLLMETWMTVSAIHLIHDVLHGRSPGAVSFNGTEEELKTLPSVILFRHAGNDSLSQLYSDLEPDIPEYTNAKKLLGYFRTVMGVQSFADIAVPADRTSSARELLIKRLAQLGFPATGAEKHPDSLLKSSLREVQSMFHLLPDGILSKATLAAINIPLAQRVAALANTLNTLRWLQLNTAPGLRILVNIPSATLMVHSEGRTILQSRIIAGKPATPTPTLSSRVTEVVLYPYWHVPYNIATRELLPVIKRNPRFLQEGGYQVLNRQGKVVTPSSINWAALSTKNFPYILRQSTGCDNALGWIKLNFYNPYSVYLHDTPGKILFGMYRRYFSHGCMRVEKAGELAKTVLGPAAAIVDSLEKLGPLKNVLPRIIRVDRPVPVFVLYQTAWHDSTGAIRFYEDVYKRLRK